MTNLSQLPSGNTKRFIAILNKKIELGRLMNALGHMSAGLVALIEQKEGNNIKDLCFLEYKDADSSIHPCISHYPFIVLKADNSNKIRTVRSKAIEMQLPFTDFVDSMIVGSSNAQLKATAQTTELDHEYFGICLFGETEELKELTGKFSLFR